MTESCSRDHCEYANSPTGVCFWPGGWCPHIAERKQAAEKRILTRKADIEKFRDERIAEGQARVKKDAADKLREYQRNYKAKQREAKRIDNKGTVPAVSSKPRDRTGSKETVGVGGGGDILRSKHYRNATRSGCK